MTSGPNTKALENLVRSVGVADDISVQRLGGGGNNRSFSVTSGARKFFLKEYFFSPNDSRDRLDTESRFCKFAWGHGISAIPEPLAFDPDNHLGLFQFIDGVRPLSSEVTTELAHDAAEFFAELNSHRTATDASNLRAASEAAFSIPEHQAIVQSRINRLLQMPGQGGMDTAALQFVKTGLLPAWDAIVRKLGHLPPEILAPIPAQDRCISPSDFGFHNVLVSQGRTVFVDFEYAGWDDPARTVADFFHQPAVPAPWSYLSDFIDSTSRFVSDAAVHRARVELLLAIYGVKWCCIILNLFLPAESQRRQFASDSQTVESQKSLKLALARATLEKTAALY